MNWNYKAPAGEETPLVLQVFNPTFWVMIEILLGLWAANLPPLAPLMQAMGLKGMVSSVYKRTLQYGSRSRTEKSRQMSMPENKYNNSDSDPIMNDSTYELNHRRTEDTV
jgi:hypothetical protein